MRLNSTPRASKGGMVKGLKGQVTPTTYLVPPHRPQGHLPCPGGPPKTNHLEDPQTQEPGHGHLRRLSHHRGHEESIFVGLALNLRTHHLHRLIGILRHPDDQSLEDFVNPSEEDFEKFFKVVSHQLIMSINVNFNICLGDDCKPL